MESVRETKKKNGQIGKRKTKSKCYLRIEARVERLKSSSEERLGSHSQVAFK